MRYDAIDELFLRMRAKAGGSHRMEPEIKTGQTRKANSHENIFNH